MNEWEKRATDFILGIILHLKTVNQINIISFCLGKRDTGSGPLYPWLWVLVKYHLFLIIMSGYFIKSKYKLISSLIRRKFQRFRNFSFENISLCLGKHIGRSLTEFATLYSFKLALNLYIITLNCRGKAEFVRNHEWAKLSPFARANYERTLRAHPILNHRKFLRVAVLYILW